jgi:hypothetical protein
MVGVAAVEETAGGERRRRCRFFLFLGCDKSHPAFTCELLKTQETEAKKKDIVCLLWAWI